MNDALPRLAGLIFDLDGTLVDSFTDIASALNRTRAQYGLGPLPTPEVRRQVGSGSAFLVRTLVPVPEADSEAAYQHYLAGYESGALDASCLYDGVTQVLDAFGDRPLAVVTNKNQGLAEQVLAGLGLKGRFALVLGGDALPRRKPDPLPLITALERLGLPAAQTVMVGDGLHDIEAGHAAGVPTVGVTTGVATRAELAAVKPLHLISRIDELLGLYR